MVINYYSFVILLAIIISINSAKLKDNDELYLIHVEYQFNVTKMKLSILNRNDAEINEYLSSRLAFMNYTNTDDIIFDLYCNYINKYWLFLVNSSDVANKLLLRDDYKKKELYINGIIVPKSLNYKMPKENKNKNIPVFIVEDNITDYLYPLDIREMKKLTYFIFETKRAISNYPELYLLLLSIFSLIISISLFIFWKITLNKTRHIYILPLHRYLFGIPFLMNIVSITLIIKSVDIKGQDPYREYESSVYIDTALITINAIYRTLLWFLILLICCGWKISIQEFRREDLKFLMKMFLIIYISMCMDQIIDSASSGIWVFHLSEIKNLIFYIVMIYLLIQKVKKAINFLNRKLYYARALSLEYVEALIYKINLMNKFKMMLFSYFGVFLFFIFIHKVVVRPYDTPLLEVYNYYIADIYLSIYFLYLLRPKTLPPNFNVDFGNDLEDDIGIVYKAFLPKYNDINKSKQYNANDLKSTKGKEIPILVIGPCITNFCSDGEDCSINNYINNIEVGFAS